ncbi:acyl-CoA carboxylase subunit epsilon [Actinophytocola xanthii]|uniref:Uncharacterized protein n=1 Tax=Actinophytocola xanthii TaxID=1912961 RepID=A0A1Q8CKX9_9PSEU|nr:acyl-CoA carboxylase subunit epsilon [Actinophytocola xanthii]OLF15014.1 hypothetical protein BU204_24260 [Actinophytocola xanthii]
MKTHILVTKGNPSDAEIVALVTALAVVTRESGPSVPASTSAWRGSARGYRKAPTAWGAAAVRWRLPARPWTS